MFCRSLFTANGDDDDDGEEYENGRGSSYLASPVTFGDFRWGPGRRGGAGRGD